MKETIRKRLEEKGHTNPDKALEQLGMKVEQKAEPRFSNEGFVWYGNMITDPTKDETGQFTVDPVVYYSRHYEDWLKWKANRSADPVQSYDSEIEEKGISGRPVSLTGFTKALRNVTKALDKLFISGYSIPALNQLDSVIVSVLHSIKSGTYEASVEEHALNVDFGGLMKTLASLSRVLDSLSGQDIDYGLLSGLERAIINAKSSLVTGNYEAKIEQKQTATIFSDPEFKLALHNIETAWINWLSGPASEELTPIEIDRVAEEVLKGVKDSLRMW